MLKQADVLAENFRPGTMEKLGFHGKGYKKSTRASYMLHRRFWTYRSAKRCSCLRYHHSGMSGIMMETGYPDAPPVRVGTLLRIYAAVSIYSAE